MSLTRCTADINEENAGGNLSPLGYAKKYVSTQVRARTRAMEQSMQAGIASVWSPYATQPVKDPVRAHAGVLLVQHLQDVVDAGDVFSLLLLSMCVGSRCGAINLRCDLCTLGREGQRPLFLLCAPDRAIQGEDSTFNASAREDSWRSDHGGDAQREAGP